MGKQLSMVKENNMKIMDDFSLWEKKIGFESLEDLEIRVLGKLFEDYCLVFKFYENFDV